MKYSVLLLLVAVLWFCGADRAFADGSTDGIVIGHEEMKQILDDYLAEQSILLPQVDLRLESVDLPAPFTVPIGRIEHQLIPARPGVIGSRRISVITRVNGQIVSNQSIRVGIEAMAEIAVAAETLRRGMVLRENHVEMRYQDISRLSDPIFDAGDVVDRLVKRSLRLGEPVQAQQIEIPPVIKRGERVVIEVQGSGLSLSAVGEARQDGRMGESIRVVNSSSSREVISRVIAPGLVRVEF